MERKCPNSSNIVVGRDTKIYIVAPAKVATGGSELLHQLGYHLRVDLGLDAYMYYYPWDIEDPVHPEYIEYGNPFVRQIIDEPQNILIVPEITPALKILNLYRNIQKVIWWLSVDYFIYSYVLSNGLWFSLRRGKEIVILGAINKIARHLIGRDLIDLKEKLLKKFFVSRTKVLCAFRELGVKQANLHLCQSQYAMDFLKSFSIDNCAYLSDYLNREFLEQDFDPDTKEDIIAFNPKKGRVFTQEITKRASDLNFIPIENLPRRGVIELLRKAKVYIDFGEHPGKDRIPREAAMLGCCVIVGAKGAAANNHDVPIPNEYKFEVSKENIPQIIDAIKRCLRDYKLVYRDFDKYREVIRKEPELFVKNLRTIFSSQADEESE